MRPLILGTFHALLLAIPACAAWCFSLVGDPAAFHDLPAVAVPDVQAGVTYERFLAIGDMGTGGCGQHAVADSLAAKAQRDGLDFILTVGDNFYPFGVSSLEDPQWRAKFEEVYSAPALQVPIYASLGNHDYASNPDAQVAYSSRSSRWIMPARYYTFHRTLADGTDVQFFAVDTTPIQMNAPVVSAQLSWLDQELSRSEARWKIVFGHHPVFSHGLHGPTPALVEKLRPLLETNRVDLYIAGHDHTLEMLKPVNGVHYCISGGGAGTDNAYPVAWTEESLYAATRGGFAFFRISKSELVIEFVRVDSTTQFAYTIRK